MSQTIGVGIIARNAQPTIRSCIESFINEVDQCVVVLAGESTDKTEEIVRSINGVEVHNFEWIDDFSAARNFCFSKLNTDWLFWVDADDEVYQSENLRKLADNAQPEIGAIWLPYHYSIDEFGNPTTIYERERLLRAKFGWIWKSRLHETVSPLSQCKFVRSDDVIIRHNHLAGQPRGERNFKLLNLMLKEDPGDKRVWLYLGHQNFAVQDWMKAAEWYLKFGSDEGCIPIERYQALCYCSKALRELRDKQAIDVALMAMALFPDYRDAYLEMAHSHLLFGDLDKAIQYAKLSDIKELIVQPPAVIFINPLDYTFNKYCLLAEAYMKKGNFDKAIEYLSQAYQVRATEDVKKQIEFVQNMKLRNRIADAIKTLAVHLLNNKEIVKLKYLLEVCPFWFKDLPDYIQLEAGVKQYTSQIKDNPQTTETEDGILVNIANVVDAYKLLTELDGKYGKITVVCPMPSPDSQQINVYSQRDMEELITSQPGRHILNLQREPSRLICEYDKNVPNGLSVRFFVGKGLEYWSPKTMAEIGCGGSETAVSKVASEMAKRNCQPIVYAMDTQIWDSVIYRHFSNYNPDTIPCHLFISSRIPTVFSDKIPAKQKWLYVHDIHCYDQLSPEMASEIDVIVCLSHWQAGHFKRVYPFLKDAEVIDMDNNPVSYDDDWTATTFYPDGKAYKVPKIAIIGNGLDTERFKKPNERVPHRFIWCSSPDRGLEELLNLWSSLREKLPDAQLKIYYGWEYFDTTLWIPEQRAFKQRILKLLKQDGVEWCGRIGQVQLAQELMKSDAMIYPPHQFRETYGIAFLEAQAAGVICFYRKNGALGETIGDRGVPLEMDASPETIISLITKTLSDNEGCKVMRDKAREYAMERSWGTQTEKMLNLYEKIGG